MEAKVIFKFLSEPTMAKKKAAGVSRFKAREAAPAQAFDPKASRAKKLVSAEDAFGGDEDECEPPRPCTAQP